MIVNIRLNLPKVFNKLNLRYNTFEKVSYDKYFIASLIHETRNEIKANALINELTGKGSLNLHFHKLYEEIKLLSEKDIEKILLDSLYPIQKIEEYLYIYIPMLHMSIFNNKISVGNLSNDEDFPRQLVEEGGSYISHEYSDPETKIKSDNYIVTITDKKIEIKMDDRFHPLNEIDFQSIVIREELDLTFYQGKIHDSISGNDWSQLYKSTFNNILDAKDYYYEDGDHFAIYNDYVKKTKISNIFGIYWVKETLYKYNESTSKDICVKASQILVESGRINEFKVSTILNILKYISRDIQQEIINYMLLKKDVKELALNGLYLIEKGYEKGWDHKVINSFFKFHEKDKQLITIYKLNNSLEYSIDHLVKIYKMDKTILIDEHKKAIESHNNDKEKIIKNIYEKIGQMIPFRDNIGKMPLYDESIKLKKFLNGTAHNKSDIKNKNLAQLKQYEEKVKEYFELYLRVKQKWDQFNSK